MISWFKFLLAYEVRELNHLIEIYLCIGVPMGWVKPSGLKKAWCLNLKQPIFWAEGVELEPDMTQYMLLGQAGLKTRPINFSYYLYSSGSASKFIGPSFPSLTLLTTVKAELEPDLFPIRSLGHSGQLIDSPNHTDDLDVNPIDLPGGKAKKCLFLSFFVNYWGFLVTTIFWL